MLLQICRFKKINYDFMGGGGFIKIFLLEVYVSGGEGDHLVQSKISVEPYYRVREFCPGLDFQTHLANSSLLSVLYMVVKLF